MDYTRTLKRFAAVLMASVAVSASVAAQKKAMDHDVYDSWQKIDGTKYTNDGSILIHEVLPQEGDGTLYVKKLAKDASIESTLVIPRGFSTSLDPMGNWLYLRIKPEFAKTRKEKIAKKKKEDMAKDTLAIVDLKAMELKKLGALDVYYVGSKAMPFMAYKTSWTEYKDSTDKKGTKKSGMIVMDPATDTRDTLRNIDKVIFTPMGDRLILTSKKDKKDTLSVNGLLVSGKLFEGGAKIQLDTIDKDAEAYARIAMNDDLSMIAFTSTRDTVKSGGKRYSLSLVKVSEYAAVSKRGSSKKAKEPVKYTYSTETIIPEGTFVEGTDNWTLTNNSGIYFTPDNKRIVTSIAALELPKDTSIVEFESAQLDIWNWDAPYTPPQQKLNLDKVKSKTYSAVVNLDEASYKIVPLTTSFEDGINLLNGGKNDLAVSRDNTKYVRESFWLAGNYVDIDIVNLRDGSRKDVVDKLDIGRFSISPSGNYLLWFDNVERQWFTYNVSTGAIVNISAQAGVPFHDELDDHPSHAKEAHERAPRWLDNDQGVLIIDRYDIWKFALDGSSAVNVTGGVGRQKHDRFNMIDIEPDSRTECEKASGVGKSYSPKHTFLVSVLGEDDEMNGYGSFNLANPAKTLKYYKDTVSFQNLVKARDASRIFFQKGNFRNCMDLYASNGIFETPSKLTAINPQMADYRWGRAELFHWTAYDGTPLKGLVFIPDDIKPGEKLPVMCYFYEKYSHQLYNHWTPAPSRSIINISFFTSRGYIVFVPDIVYVDGHPGESAYNCICSGCEALCEAYPAADKSKMAIQGQSWGGYQTAWLVTRTNMFAAAGAGAPVSNMTSAYGGIRWGSGMTRAGQYEHGQSRIGKSLWDEGGLELYLENSPIFNADKVQTPLLIMHNDNDGAVPWYQGIEYFSDLRRLDKPCWLLQYNREAHNLVERRNCKDLSIRLSQFFDHYLKGEPMPAWMKTGVPTTRKGQYYGLELAE